MSVSSLAAPELRYGEGDPSSGKPPQEKEIVCCSAKASYRMGTEKEQELSCGPLLERQNCLFTGLAEDRREGLVMRR